MKMLLLSSSVLVLGLEELRSMCYDTNSSHDDMTTKLTMVFDYCFIYHHQLNNVIFPTMEVRVHSYLKFS